MTIAIPKRPLRRRVKKEKKNYNLALTANHLFSGKVVYFTGSGWANLLHDAALSLDGDSLISQAQNYIKNESFVGLELIKIDKLYNQLIPLTTKEKIRLSGPSIIYN